MRYFFIFLCVNTILFHCIFINGSTVAKIPLTAKATGRVVNLQNQSLEQMNIPSQPLSFFTTKAVSVKAGAADNGIIFKGMSEPTSDDYKNGFLCGAGGVGAAASTGTSFEAEDCSSSAIAQAVGFDLSHGDTLQFFNNFTYWLRKKGEREQNLKINNPDLKGTALDNRMVREGWDTIGACCILISTNPILQKVIAPEIQAKQDEVKVIAQLWYNGDNMLQFWSQDVKLLKKGQGFTVNISTQEDDFGKKVVQSLAQATVAEDVTMDTAKSLSKKSKKNKKSSSKKSTNNKAQDVVDKGIDTYIATVRNLMQPNNRKKETYEQATNSPRMIRINV